MLDKLKKITKSTAIYSLGQIAPKMVGLVLLPFFTNEAYLSVDDYGKLSMLEASSAFLITLSVLDSTMPSKDGISIKTILTTGNQLFLHSFLQLFYLLQFSGDCFPFSLNSYQ